jgi:MSHA biogenesis protein MshJ
MKELLVIREKLAVVLAKIDALSRRERLLVLMTTLTFLTGTWQLLLMEPLGQRADASRMEIQTLHERIDSANRNLEEQILQLAGAGNEKRTRIALLRQRIDEINANLGNFAAELVDPAEMARVLEEVLKEQSHLSLIRIRNTSPEELSAGEEADATTLYRHGLEIEVEGSFRDCLDYLTEIEALPWRLYWQVLDLEVIEYPRNRIRLEVSTLSLDEEWIGA